MGSFFSSQEAAAIVHTQIEGIDMVWQRVYAYAPSQLREAARLI
jgi:hypothetical protein